MPHPQNDPQELENPTVANDMAMADKRNRLKIRTLEDLSLLRPRTLQFDSILAILAECPDAVADPIELIGGKGSIRIQSFRAGQACVSLVGVDLSDPLVSLVVGSVQDGYEVVQDSVRKRGEVYEIDLPGEVPPLESVPGRASKRWMLVVSKRR
jgi:hypothetical protein